MIIITGASNNHYKTLIQFLNSLLEYIDETIEFIIVYDLGIDEDKWKDLQDTFSDKLIYKTFQYDKYPDWYNIETNAGEYAWKPAIIYETYLAYTGSVIMWMDAGTMMKRINNLEDIIRQEGIHSGRSSGDIKKWTHPTTLELLKPKNVDLQCRVAGNLGLDTSVEWVREFIEEFYNLSTNKECIAPEGSSRDNHRQDQAILTILYYKYKEYYNPKEYMVQGVFYTSHNDID